MLQPGDVLAYKGGVSYTGVLHLRRSGSIEAPIKRIGSYPGFGSGRAIFDGTELGVSVRAATSSIDAGGISNWADADIRILEYEAREAGMVLAFFDSTGLLFENQYPIPEDWYLYDNVGSPPGHFLNVAIADWETSPKIDSAELAAQLAGQEGWARLWVWYGNSVGAEIGIESVVGNIVTLAAAVPGQPYEPTTKVAIRSTRKSLTPGTWAPLSATKAVARIRSGGGQIRIGRSLKYTSGSSSWWRLINLTNVSQVHFKGFEFFGFVEQFGANESLFQASIGNCDGLLVEDNVFTDFVGKGSPVCLSSTAITNQTIRRNVFQNLVNYGAVLCSNVGFLIEENIFYRIGRTAIRMTGASNSPSISTLGVIRRNIFSALRGVHTNGISFYGNWRDYLVEDNAVLDTSRPFTTQGSPLNPTGRAFRGNLFVASLDGNGWGFWHNGTTNLEGMDIDNNICVGHSAGSLLKSQCVALRFVDNLGTDGTAGNKAQSGPGWALEIGSSDERDTWEVSGNQSITPAYLTQPGVILSRDRILIPRKRGTLDIDLRTVGI